MSAGAGKASDLLATFEHPLTDEQVDEVRDHLRGHGTAFLRIADGHVSVIDPANVSAPTDGDHAPQ